MDSTNSNLNTEQKWYQFWLEQNLFKADPESNKPPYSLLMPPPNVNGELHLGHAMQQSILDAIARFKRLQGFDVLLLPGVDHAGIIFESTFNKELAKEGLSKYKLGYEEWMKRAWQFKEEVYNSFHKTWTFLGVSADWDREVFTLEPKVKKAVLEEFKTFWEQDLLYKGAYIVQWCPKCGTAIEDVEMEYQEREEKLYYVKYVINDFPSVIPTEAGIHSNGSPIRSGMTIESGMTDGDFITVATARPETIFADTAIATYPGHPSFKQFVGKMAINPLTGNKLPILEDERVEKDFGTGALKITPGHDLLDYQIGKDNSLPILHSIDKTGKMTELTGELQGLKIGEAREKAVEKLQKAGAIEKIEDYKHSVPVCERCKTVVEPLISEEWFVKMKPLAEKALTNLDKINFLPKNYHEIIGNWYREIHDWSISRSLWWGHRIPVWYCQKCNPKHAVGKDQGMVISLEKPNIPCPKCGGSDWFQDEQVLDTWFSSGLWPIATLGWPSFAKASDGKPALPEEMKKYFPWDFELTAPEIKYLWIARQIMLSLWFTGSIPFKNMFFHGTLRDTNGQKFSKSLGNGINPYDLVATWGVDPTRMALYSYSAPGRDGRVSRQIMDERCRNFRNFGTKLKNIYRFIYELRPSSSHPERSEGSLARLAESAKRANASIKDSQSTIEILRSAQNDISHKDDQQIIKELNSTIKAVTENLESFQLHLATEEIYNFVWHQLADVYIEKTKTRRGEAQPVLEHVFEYTLKLLHPFMPFTTEELWQKLEGKNESIMTAEWPKDNRRELRPIL